MSVPITDETIEAIAQKLRCADKSVLRRVLRLPIRGQRLSAEIDAELDARGVRVPPEPPPASAA